MKKKLMIATGILSTALSVNAMAYDSKWYDVTSWFNNSKDGYDISSYNVEKSKTDGTRVITIKGQKDFGTADAPELKDFTVTIETKRTVTVDGDLTDAQKEELKAISQKHGKKRGDRGNRH